MSENGKLVFATYFSECNNVHLTKDFGLIPYTLQRDYGYRSYMICFNNDEYPALHNEVSGLGMIFLKKSKSWFFENIRRIKYRNESHFLLYWLLDKIDLAFTSAYTLRLLLKHGKDIDVLQVYHFRYESIVTGILYHLINPRGILYLKMDTESDHYKYLETHPKKLKNTLHLSYLLFKIASFDIISCEGEKLCEFIKEKHPLYSKYKDRIYHIPNGVNIKNLPAPSIDYKQKKNMIIHVARLGTYQKASDILLKAFSQVSPDYPEWELVLIGHMNEDFKKYYRKFIEENKAVGERIHHIDFLEDRQDLYRYYADAKIIAMPSRFETFSLAMLEASYYGDVLLGSDISTAVDMTENGKHGYVCPVDDIGCFTKTLRFMLSHEDELMLRSASISTRIKDYYDWSIICKNLDGIIRSYEKLR